ncbi:hypothetical protein [Dyadobacter sp. Leaf189]|uniref:hypothetical protein n=1 Tax=Dyadobacter sp. Leaf189 TaxID=1736295 RepID=UPI0007003D13|nr:hypothetical protein [Dyadobacter sp. Leaf189]KQS31447.1 hypothetical protein ASG33_14145 [Dyadobacter sp. Leaf189]
MKDRDRISNLEELIADMLLRLDRLEDGQVRLENGQARLEIGQARLENGQERLENGQEQLEDGYKHTSSKLDRMEGLMGKLIENQMELSDRQGGFQEALLDIIKVIRKNSTDIEVIKDTMVTKDTLAHFMEAMMNRFDRFDARFEGIEQDIDILKLR